VGIGASAGGLEAFIEMLGALPVDTGMAFVLVPHLAPRYASHMAEILSRATAMQVTEAGDEERVEPNRVYVIPPNHNMIFSQGVLRLLPREKGPGQHRPIDFFFRSLAEDQGDRAIGVVLSGTASDGTLGLEEIKALGGITFAQDDTARQSSMPHSAVDSGCVDFVLPPTEIASEIARIARHPHTAHGAPARRKTDPAHVQVLETVHKAMGVDFSRYKASSVYRRITRRMVLNKTETLRDYARLLRKNPGEVEALYQDILINVTRFFRDPETFEALKSTILPGLFANRSRPEPLRVWVLGCSTGEEAYSIAILFAELAHAKGAQIPVQVFATDLNGAVIEKARAGVYPKSIAQDVSPERLRRFFVEVEGSYRITKTIREMCVFARHNVLTDPPFSQIDLISCRNLLIYLEPALQQKIVPLLHYALKPGGFLLLGNSESIGSYRDLFEMPDVRHKIYSRKPSASRASFGQPAASRQPRDRSRPAPGRSRPAGDAAGDVQKEADRILLARYVPPGVVVNADLDILQFRGDTAPYLAPAEGKASLNLFKMAREGLAVALRTAIARARNEEGPVREERLQVQFQGETRAVTLEVIPLKGGPDAEGGFLVLFEEPPVPGPRRRKPRANAAAATAADNARQEETDRLGQELAATRLYLQSVIEQQEAANEELQSANEEAQSANEELQSINEELETSKEEIQSSNEELATVNDELQNRNTELNLLNNDLFNLLTSVEMAIVIVGKDLRVRRFTPMAETAFNLIPSDVGRPISGFKLDFNVPDLAAMLAEVMKTASPREHEVQDTKGVWYSLRIQPYKTLEGKIDGAVILLVDVDTLKRAREYAESMETALHERLGELAAADRSKNEFLALLAHELRNPLAPLRNAAHVLETAGVGGADEDAVRQARSMMSRQIQNMARLIEDLLDVSRITRGEVRLRRERVELAALLRQVTELTQPLREKNGQTLSLSLPPEPVYLDADPTRLDQIFGNLLNNAAKFTPYGGQCWVTAELVREALPEAPGEVVVRVRDDGAGMAPETLPRIFELFMQADRSYDRAGGGLGIGLTLVRRLAELHGGSVEARSAGLGEGSELVVRLPVLAPVNRESERSVGVAAAEAELSPAAAQLRRVLVVDDNVDTAESLAMLLRLKGHDVQVAYDGPAALDAARAFHPEAVLLDIGLPGLDGYQVAARLRRRRRTAGSLLVALTGYGQEDDQRRAEHAGFDHHLTKPVDPQVIYDLLAKPITD
jgi:two-component system CheB/CheR fusion protein